MGKRSAEPTSLTFLGATGTVTGSKFLFDTGSSGVLVDCGLFQGLAPLRRRNWQPPRLDLDRLDAVVLTHAHLDHCGYLPVLVRNGWRGPVYTTEGTADLAAIVLADSAHLMVEDARQANEGGWTRHNPALPLYDTDDAAAAVRLFQTMDFDVPWRIARGVDLEFGRSGHILGSAWANLDLGGRTAVVSGDLGRQHHRILLPPRPRPECDALLVESTYGDRAHDDERATALLADTIRRTAARGGSVLIPAFAVDRTEVVLIELAKLTRAGTIPELPVFVDSPMALASLRVYRQAVAKAWPEVRPELLHTHEDPFDPGRLAELHTATQSMTVNNPAQPSIIISASGMATGGRVLHHLKQMLPDPRHTVLVVGYAAAGTRSRQLATGAREIKIHGRYVPVKAEVQVLDAFSAHADADELLAWTTDGPEPGTTYLVHGEPEASTALAARLSAEHGWNAVVPRDGERVLI
ncbi:MBL fold metallo-hydrolase [Actinosynnema sp. NPDC002837]